MEGVLSEASKWPGILPEDLDKKRINEREQLRIRRNASILNRTLPQKELPVEAEYPDKKTARQEIGDQVTENRIRLTEAEGKYYTPLGSDLKQLDYRSDVPTRVKIGPNVFETKDVTSYAEGSSKNITLQKPPEAKYEVEEIPGLKLNSKEVRTYNSTGMYRGQFINPIVLDQVERLDAAKAWPEGKSLKGFLKAMSYGWNTIADKETKFFEKKTGHESHRGHAISVEQGGSNWWTNVAPQYAKATDPDVSIEGPDKISANLAIGKESLKDLDDLEMAGNYGVNVPKAFQAYLTEGDEGILDLRRFSVDARTRIFHKTGVTAEGQVQEEELNLRREQHNKLIAEANKGVAPPLSKAKTPKDLFFNAVRTTSRIAGQSPNPLANVAGDIVGAVMDTAVYIANPNDPDALADLTLSGSQALISIGSTALAFVPIPGARPGAYALMKVGDNIGKVEKIWNLTREGRTLARQVKNGQTPTLQKKGPEIVEHQKAERRGGITQANWERIIGDLHSGKTGQYRSPGADRYSPRFKKLN